MWTLQVRIEVISFMKVKKLVGKKKKLVGNLIPSYEKWSLWPLLEGHKEIFGRCGGGRDIFYPC